MPRDVQKVKVLPRSGFDKSHRNSLTMKCGTITPVMVDEVIPNTKVNCRLALTAALPPLASDAFMNVKLKVEAFFVPFRLLFGSFESWFANEEVQYLEGFDSASDMKLGLREGMAPTMQCPSAAMSGPGSLADYLGLRQTSQQANNYEVSALPFLAYHRIWDDWYRNTKVQQSCFVRSGIGDTSDISISGSLPLPAGVVPYFFTSYDKYRIDDLTLADGNSLDNLRQRNFGQDYFTNAMPRAQFGSPMEVSVVSNKFTIAQLRSMNSLQQFEERNNIASSRLQDVVLARYGADLSSGVAQRCVLLGASSYNVYSKGVFATAGASGATRNPFYDSSSAMPGARFGSAYAEGSDFVIKDFVANEPGYIFVNASIVPVVAYDSGIPKYMQSYLSRGSIVEMANPLLENVGLEPIYSKELTGLYSDTGIFGYTDRYSRFKIKNDEIHGLLHGGSSLETFALKRKFTVANQQISSSFLEIPVGYLDQVTAVASAASSFGAWVDMYFDYKVSQPLSQFSMPSLQNPAEEHGVDVVLHRGAFSL